ncbi:MAG: PIG-L family deacetylase [Chloroflexota bacterium]|nr:MAG: PIG-L family deacetylase [Chloroflexota bacterium]
MTDSSRNTPDPEQQGSRGQPGTEPGEIEGPITVLVIAAHPDDPEFGAGGTTALWAKQGREIFQLVCTNGEKGSSDPEMTSEKLVALREEEQLAAGRVLGAKKTMFLRLPDGEISPDLTLRRGIVKAIRMVRPEIIITHDPTSVYTDSSINHPDHRAVGHATLDSVYPTARDRLNFPEHEQAGLLPHKVREVLLWGSREPNFFVDIAEVFDTKIAALTCHKTQIPNPDELAKRMRERAENLAKEYTGDDPRPVYAEGFRRITLMR